MGPLICVTSAQTGTAMYVRADLIIQILPSNDTKQTWIHLNINGDRPVLAVTETVEEMIAKYNKAREENKNGI